PFWTSGTRIIKSMGRSVQEG
ncbi:unnamed protein product, partial [Allacma fusca]